MTTPLEELRESIDSYDTAIRTYKKTTIAVTQANLVSDSLNGVFKVLSNLDERLRKLETIT